MPSHPFIDDSARDDGSEDESEDEDEERDDISIDDDEGNEGEDGKPSFDHF